MASRSRTYERRCLCQQRRGGHWQASFPFAADGIPDSSGNGDICRMSRRQKNTWRVVFDISDVTGIRRTEGGFDHEDPINSVWPSLPIVSDLSVPIEQWLPNFPYGSIGYDFTGELSENLPGARIGQTGTPRLLTSDYDFQGTCLSQHHLNCHGRDGPIGI